MPKGVHRTIEERLADLESQREELLAAQAAEEQYDPITSAINGRTVRAKFENVEMYYTLSVPGYRKFIREAWKNDCAVEITDVPNKSGSHCVISAVPNGIVQN